MEKEFFKGALEIFNCKSSDNLYLVLILPSEQFYDFQFFIEVHKMRRPQYIYLTTSIENSYWKQNKTTK